MTTSWQIINNIALRMQKETQRLKDIEAIVKEHPEWIEQSPQLKELLSVKYAILP